MGLEVTGNTSERGNIAEVLGECLIWELLQGSTMSWARTCPVLIPGLLPSATAAKDPATVLELVRGPTAGQTTGRSVQQKDPSSESTSSGDDNIPLPGRYKCYLAPLVKTTTLC